MTEGIDGYVSPEAQVPMAAGYDDGAAWANQYEAFMSLLRDQAEVQELRKAGVLNARQVVIDNIAEQRVAMNTLEAEYTKIQEQISTASDGYKAFQEREDLGTRVQDALTTPKAEGTTYALPTHEEDDASLEAVAYTGINLEGVEAKASEFGKSIADKLQQIENDTRVEMASKYGALRANSDKILADLKTQYSTTAMDFEAYRLLDAVLDKLLGEYGSGGEGGAPSVSSLANSSVAQNTGFFNSRESSNGEMSYLRVNSDESRPTGNGFESVVSRESAEQKKGSVLSRVKTWLQN